MKRVIEKAIWIVILAGVYYGALVFSYVVKYGWAHAWVVSGIAGMVLAAVVVMLGGILWLALRLLTKG